MKKAALGCLVALGILVGFLILVPIVVIATSGPERNSVLKLEIKGEILEGRPDDFFAQVLLSKATTFKDYLDALEKAKEDPKINGVFAQVGRFSLGWGRAQELRNKLQEFRESGKWAVAFLETAGEFAPGGKSYYLATAFEEVYLAPPGDIHLVGIRAEVPFVRGALEKLRIYPDLDHIGKYKNAKNFMTEKEFTPAHREATESLVDSLYRQLLRGIAEGRGMTEEEVAAIIDRGPFISREALSEGLVDDLLYLDQVREKLKERNGGDLPFVKPHRYLKRGRPGSKGKHRIALIYGIGTVVNGPSSFDPFSHQQQMGSDTIAKAIRQAREDSGIQAIVLRVDSPGGSYIASDIIRRESALAAETKPLVVSMGDVAASGGYFVSMPADRILAEPGTITASIGVVAGKFNMKGFYNMLGITMDSVSRGNHSGFYSTYRNYTDDEREIFHKQLWRIYDDFVAKVAENRGMEEEVVDRLARGRVYTGEDALELGLIDELGGLEAAIRRARELAEIPEGEKVRIQVFPASKTLLQSLRGKEMRIPGSLRSLSRLLRTIQREHLADTELGALRMPYPIHVD